MTKNVLQWGEYAYSSFESDPSFLARAELKDLQVMRDSIPWQMNLQTNRQKKENLQVCLTAINLQIESRRTTQKSEKDAKSLGFKAAYNQITSRQFYIIGFAASIVAAVCSLFRVQQYLPQMISFQGPWYMWFFIFFRSVGGLAIVILVLYNYLSIRRSLSKTVVQIQQKHSQKQPLKTKDTPDIR